MVYTIVAGMVSLAGVFCWRDILEDGKELLKKLATICDTGTSGGTGIDLLSVVVPSSSYVSGVG